LYGRKHDFIEIRKSDFSEMVERMDSVKNLIFVRRLISKENIDWLFAWEWRLPLHSPE